MGALLAKLIFSKAGTILAGGSAIVLAFLLVSAKLDLAHTQSQLRDRTAELGTANHDLDQCHQNGDKLDAALKAQNASIAAAKAQGDKIAADAAIAVQQAQDALLKARKAASVISAPIVATEACARAEEIDKRFLGANQ